MGTVIRLKCDNGDYDKAFSIGSGMRFIPKAEIPEYLDDKQKYEFERFLTPDSVINQRQSLCFCKRCNEYGTMKVFDVKNTKIKHFTADSECGHKAYNFKLFGNPLEKDDITCPVCGRKLHISNVGSWD